jgi:hypothetical protein
MSSAARALKPSSGKAGQAGEESNRSREKIRRKSVAGCPLSFRTAYPPYGSELADGLAWISSRKDSPFIPQFYVE